MKSILDKVTKRFILGEALNFDAAASVQALSDIVSSIRITNKTDEISKRKNRIFGRRTKSFERGKINGWYSWAYVPSL